jgi:hypothetical protein
MKKSVVMQARAIKLSKETVKSLLVATGIKAGQRGSTVPRSWCESCETHCGSN